MVSRDPFRVIPSALHVTPLTDYYLRKQSFLTTLRSRQDVSASSVLGRCANCGCVDRYIVRSESWAGVQSTLPRVEACLQ